MYLNDKKSLTILAISDSKAGGGQTVVLGLASFFNNNGGVLVLCPMGSLYERLSEKGIPVSETNFGLRHLLSLRRKLTQFNNATINTHLLGTAFWTVLSLSIYNRAKVVVTLHNPLMYENMTSVKKLIFPIILRLLTIKVKRFIGVSEEICASVKKYICNIPIHYFPTSVNVNDFPYCGIDISKSTYNIAIVGRLSFAKGHNYFIAAADLICNVRSDITFYIVGDGELRDELERKVHDLNLTSKIIFMGYLTDIKPVLRTTDIVVIPSLFEGIPCLLLETMAMGIPVIASAVGGIPNVITNGHNGILVSARNEKELCDAIIKLVEDKALRLKLSENGRDKIEKDFNSEMTYREYAKILNNERLSE